jgi:hypothetical protein
VYADAALRHAARRLHLHVVLAGVEHIQVHGHRRLTGRDPCKSLQPGLLDARCCASCLHAFPGPPLLFGPAPPSLQHLQHAAGGVQLQLERTLLLPRAQKDGLLGHADLHGQV